MPVTKREVVRKFTEALHEGTAAVFAGAGLSRAAGYVDWKGLLRQIAEDLGLDVDREHDLVSLVQYHRTARGGRRAEVNQAILDEFTRGSEVTESHRVLASLPIQTYWTTNYDKFIEQSLEEAGKTPDAKIVPENLSITMRRRDAVVYKMHGDVTLPHAAVISKDDYEDYERTRALYSINLQGDLVSKTFLFLGFSFTDPNLALVLARIRALLEENARTHYAVFKRVLEDDYESHEDYLYAKTKQEHQINDLSRYGIEAVLLDRYDEIPELLGTIRDRFRMRTVFVSGAAHDYGPHGESDAIRFVHDLSRDLADKDYRVVSGFGLGIGSAVINGVLNYVFDSKYQHLDEHLHLRPFPQFQTGDLPRSELWRRYRQEMLAPSGAAVFVFGNKLVDGEVVPSNGMVEEFELALEAGAHVTPIGARGFTARKLWERATSDPARHLGPNAKAHDLLHQLGDETLSFDDLRHRTLHLLNILRDTR